MKLYTRHNCLTGYNEAIPEDIIAAFNDLPLPVRMRIAAAVAQDVVDEKARRGYGGWPAGTNFVTGDLLQMANEWEREDAEKAKEAAEVEELAQVIAEHIYGDNTAVFTGSRELVREILEWVKNRKQADERVGLHDCEYDDPRMCAWPGHRKAQS